MPGADRKTRRLLLIGFGALLLLLAVSGFGALSVIRNIQQQSDRIRDDYVQRDQTLEQLRSNIYLSGTYVRDLLLEPDAARAELHRRELESDLRLIGSKITDYQPLLTNEERAPFNEFKTELEAYFKSLEPALRWDAPQRREFGYNFMQNTLLPRRFTIVQVADQISALNKRQMEAGNRQIADLFARFRRMLVIFVLLALGCGALVAFASIRSVLRLERISASRLREAEHAREDLHELSGRLLEVQESERRALSRELHDEVGQSLSALLLGIGNIAALVSNPSPEFRTQLSELKHLAERTVAMVRDMSLLLRPSMLDDLGLIPAVQWQAREVSRNHGVYVQVHAGSIPEDLPDEHKTCVYRIVQEALRNAVRHAGAKQVRVDLRRADRGEGMHALVLRIEDDGKGFIPEQEKGLGLLGMEERVTHLHGHFRITSQPGRGASIQVELPLAAMSEEARV